MKRILFAGAALFALTGIAQAADPFVGMYGNTLTITGADGAKMTAFINQDMSWERHSADGSVVKGTYAWKDATTACFTQTDPAPKSPDQATTCYANQMAHQVGDTWTVSGADGKGSTLMLTSGR